MSHVLRQFHDISPSYLDDIFVHSRAADSETDLDVHLCHLRAVFQAVRENKLYASQKKCIFCASETPVLGSYVSADGTDPEKLASICCWLTPRDQKQLRQWFCLTSYLHHYAKSFAALARSLSQSLKKDTT